MKCLNLFLALSLPLLLLSACAGTPQQDPLKNTKKLVSQGHKSLYENGAFHIPNTSMSLIPAGPGAFEFAMELGGFRARQSFMTSVKNAADSVTVVSVGTEKTYRFSKDIFDGGNEFAGWVTDHSRPGSMLLMKRAYPDAKYIIGSSWQAAKTVGGVLAEGGDTIAQGSLNVASAINREGESGSQSVLKNSWQTGSGWIKSGVRQGGQTMKGGANDFITGYVALPKNLASRASNMNPESSWHQYAKASKPVHEWREETSDKLAFYVKDTTENYFSNVGDSFKKGKKELADTTQTGSLAVLKSLGWALHGVFWEGMIKPVTKISAGSLGYIAVNSVVYPVVLLGQGTATMAELAVKVTWNSGAMAYDVVAPTGKAALAGIFGTVEAAAGTLAGGAVISGGAAVSGVEYAGTKALAAVVATGGYTVGKGVKYIGVPIAASGVVIGGTAVGVAVAGTEAVAGVALLGSGEAVGASSRVVGTATSATTLAVGTTGSVVTGVGLGVYELSKAVVVPVGYELSMGVVLGYGSVSQIAAHSILAVSDVSYMVLSMEGPNWVLYGVKGMCAYANHARRLGKTDEGVNAFVEDALFSTMTNVNFDIGAGLELVLECGKQNLRVMEMLDEGHTERFGAPAPAAVQEGTQAGPGILISGHDMVDMDNLLKQCEGTDVKVYTHGEMLPAHMYPKLREHPNLGGHYGGAWQKQRKEFAEFAGPALVTTNCVVLPKESYAGRLFTTRVTAVPGGTRITNEDFSHVIAKAKE